VISAAMRDVLIGHIDGPVEFAPRDRDPANIRSVVRALLSRDLLHASNPNRPGHTFITAAGRRELCKALANWADALTRARGISNGGLPPPRISRMLREVRLEAKLFALKPAAVDRLLTRLRVPSSPHEREEKGTCDTT
jgi:hypothetical protein